MSWRKGKKERTRRALAEAAVSLFEINGYAETTVAEIAAAAGVSTRTFFGYFATKEELLFPESDDRVAAAVEAIAARSPSDGPADVLLRALTRVGESSDDMVGRAAVLRTRLIRTVPAVQGYALRMQWQAQRDIAGHLHRAFPDSLDAVSAAALVGAFVGAVTGALQVLLDDAAVSPDRLKRKLNEATAIALGPWRAPHRS